MKNQHKQRHKEKAEPEGSAFCYGSAAKATVIPPCRGILNLYTDQPKMPRPKKVSTWPTSTSSMPRGTMNLMQMVKKVSSLVVPP